VTVATECNLHLCPHFMCWTVSWQPAQ